MARAVIDASVVIAGINADANDKRERTGFDILRGVDGGQLPTGVITSDALLEIMNVVHEREGNDAAIDLLDRFVEGAHFRLPHNSKANSGIGRSLFRTYPALSYGDAMQVAYMQQADIEYIYSFDADFDAVEDITRLTTAVNPFDG
jgi:predicted nucleic acid-binding protein